MKNRIKKRTKRRTKFIFAFAVILIILSVFPDCRADSVADEFFESGAADSIADKAKSENIDKVYDGFDFAEFAKEIMTANAFYPEKIVGKAAYVLFGAVADNAHMLVVLIALALVGGIISNLQSSFNTKATAETAFFAFYAVYAGILAVCVYNCLDTARRTVEEQSAFLQAAAPTYIGMMIASGSVMTGTAAKPLILYFISLISIAVKDFFIPFSFMIFVLAIINNLSGKMHITKLVNLFKFTVSKLLTALMTVFVTLLTLSGMSAQSVDTLSARAAKYAAQNFVPVVGNVLSSTIDTVYASAAVLRSALGAAGIVTVALLCAYPVLKFGALIFLYKLAAAIIEPLADKRISNAVNEAANAISLLFSLLVCVAVVFSLAVAYLAEFAVGVR